MIELFSGLIAFIGQVKQTYNHYKVEELLNLLSNHEYEVDKVVKIITPIKNAYKID